MTDAYIPVAGTSPERKLQTYRNVIGGIPVDSEAVTPTDPAGEPYSESNRFPVDTGLAQPVQDGGTVNVGNQPTEFPLPEPQAAILSARNNAYATLVNALPDTTAKEIRIDDVDGGDLYHGRAVDGTAESAASWEIVRFYREASTGTVTRHRYRTGVKWSERTSGWT